MCETGRESGIPPRRYEELLWRAANNPGVSRLIAGNLEQMEKRPCGVHRAGRERNARHHRLSSNHSSSRQAPPPLPTFPHTQKIPGSIHRGENVSVGSNRLTSDLRGMCKETNDLKLYF